MLQPLLRGALLGIATCLTLGPVTVAVVRAGLERRVAAAILCGAGAALVDAIESQLAHRGALELVHRFPGSIPVLFVAAGCILIASGARGMLRRARPAPEPAISSGARAFLQGVVMTALNPATLLGWIALAGSLFADFGDAQAIFASLGVGAGVLAWFVGVASMALRGSSVLGARARGVLRALDVVLGCAGVYLVLRGVLAALRG